MSGYSARILADSVSPDGNRLTTMEVVIPRPVLAEFNTHRMLSRNSASSRAIPVEKQIEFVLTDPYIPEKFGINQAGMQSAKFLEGSRHEDAVHNVLIKRDRAVLGALEDLFGRDGVLEYISRNRQSRILLDGMEDEDRAAVRAMLVDYKAFQKALRSDPDFIKRLPASFLGIHKQTLNRYLEPFLWQTIITSATEWVNFLNLRDHADAQHDIAEPARLMREALNASTPVELDYGQWHLPLVQEDEKHLVADDVELWKRISSGRCARVSYLTHDGVRDLAKDAELCDSLIKGWHMSPLEHPATPVRPDYTGDTGNFVGWLQHRKEIQDEAVFPG